MVYRGRTKGRADGDLTQRLKTWEICRDRVARSKVRWLAKALGRDHVMFLDRFDAILEAYKTRAMEYGCFIAVRP